MHGMRDLIWGENTTLALGEKQCRKFSAFSLEYGWFRAQNQYSKELDDVSILCESGKDDKTLMKLNVNILLQYCIKHNIEIIANQKVFDSDYCDEFLKHDILVLPRLGYKGCQMLKSMIKSDIVLTSMEQLSSISPTR